MCRVNRSFFKFSNDFTSSNFIAVFYLNRPTFQDFIRLWNHFTKINLHRSLIKVFFTLLNVCGTRNFGNNRFTFRHTASFKELFNTWQTCGDVTTRSHTTGMESSQGQLGTRLTNGLRSHDTNSRAEFHHGASTKILAVTIGTNTMHKFTG